MIIREERGGSAGLMGATYVCYCIVLKVMVLLLC